MTRADDEIRLHRSRVIRTVLIALGFVFVACGVIGVFLPLIPTTPFVLLAAACFARGSERFYRWLLSNRIFGPLIREWRQTRTVPRRAKGWALALIAVTFGSTALFVVSEPIVRIVVLACGAVALTAVSRLRVRDSQPDLAEGPAPASD